MDFNHATELPFNPNRTDWAILTATQEANGPHTSVENAEAQGRLLSALAALRVPFKTCRGVYNGVDQGLSVLVLGITERAAVGLGQILKQETILTYKGLVSCNTGYVLSERDPENDISGAAAIGRTGYTVFPNGVAWSAGLPGERNPADVKGKEGFEV